jgi:hypothetical protein
MNANELADKLLGSLTMEYDCDKYMEQAATMLRQQAKELDEAGHMIGVLREYISDLENGLDSSIKLNKAQAERQVKELTDDEIADLIKAANDEIGFRHVRIFDFVKVFLKVLRKAQEK